MAVVEKSRVGGTCIIDGCTPTKTMIASARVARLAIRSSDFGVETGQVYRTLVVEQVDGSGDTETVTAERIFVDMGGQPRIPDIEGLSPG